MVKLNMTTILLPPKILTSQRLRKCLEIECENCQDGVTRVACFYDPKNPEKPLDKPQIFTKNLPCRHGRYFIENSTLVSQLNQEPQAKCGDYA